MKIDYKNLSHLALNALAKEDAIFTIFEFLKEHIPFDTVTCFSIDRNEMLFTNVIEYTATRIEQTSSYQIRKVLPISTLKNIFGENLDKVYHVKDEKQQKDFGEMKLFHYKFASSISTFIYISERRDYHIMISLLSQKENIFTDEHIELLLSLRPLFVEHIIPLYLNNPETYLRLTSTGPLPHTFEEQLRILPDMKEVMQRVDNVAEYDTTVLIEGPTGSGKELVAETVHSLSPRYEKPFIRVNCGAIPESLLESELFGYEKGAFTGAVQARKGYFEQANNGTIYLDEIGELSKNAQVRLLRVLENREIQRIGSERTIKLDIRIIAATHRNIREMVQNSTFREDLYHRLNIFPIKIPSLTQRTRDIPILVKYFYVLFVQKFQIKNPPILSEHSLKYLLNLSWSGNVRQLRHSVERALLESKGQSKKELDFSFLSETAVLLHNKDKKILTAEEIQLALYKAKGKIQGKDGAAALLKIHPATLRSRMRVLDIPFTKKDLQNNKKNK